MGSLFDGIGGFPLASSRLGIIPIWASEIVPDCISITRRHFPNMKHLGDITKINGVEIEPVDIITFGSPCQDLSIAGKRAGLNGVRSGLFREAVRIIKEMRGITNGACPRYAVWENVRGAFSSNKGYDFLSVLEELGAIAEPEISIPRPLQGDGNIIWDNAGAVMGDGWSVAWRVLDAQYWGVPQRRKRIFLVADFRGQCAGEILFKPESLPGYSAESGAGGKGTAGNTESGVRAAGFNGWRSVTGTLEYEDDRAPCMQATMPPNIVIGVDGHNQNLTGDITNTLKGGRVDKDNIPILCLENHPNDGRIKINKDGVVQTLSSLMGTGGNNTPMVMEHRINQEINSLAVHQNQNGEVRAGKVANTLNTNGNASGRNAPLVATFSIQGFGDYKSADCASALKSRDHKDSADLIINNYSARRLTPLECERLQGFPDGWTEYGHDGRKISDSARYRALGNSLAIPCVEFIMQRIRGAA
jgi:DNA (cytosine-5)-methyltransferase 1